MPLELTNLPLAGLQIEQRGVFEAGASVGSGTTDIFLFPPRGTRGSLLDGDQTLASTEISRIRITNGGNRLTINDSDQPNALNLEDYFESGGDGRDLTIYFVTKLGMFSIPIADSNDNDNYANIGGSFIRFDLSNNNIDQGDGFGFDNAGAGFGQARFLPAAYSARDVLRSIDNGDRFILAFARPIPRRAVTAARTFGAPSTTADVAVRAAVRHEVTAGKTFAVAAFAGPVVNLRSSPRKAITAAKVLPAMTTTVSASVRTAVRKVLTAAATFPAMSSSVAVQQRMSMRRVVQATLTMPSPVFAVEVQARAPPRHVVTASFLTDKPTFTAAPVQKRVPARKQLQANAAFPALTSTTTLGVDEPRLTLADFNNPDGRRIDCLALITRRQTGNTLWNRAGSRFSGTDTLDDGEIGIGDDDTPITRIRHTSATRLQFNDDGALNLGSYFTSNRAELEIAIQTIDGFAAFSVIGNIVTPGPGGGYIWFSIPAEVNTLLSELAVRDHFIFAITLPASRHDLLAEEQFPNISASISVQKRVPARKQLQAAGALSAMSSSAAVTRRLATEHLITAGTRLAAMSMTTAVQKRAAPRQIVTASRTLPALTIAQPMVRKRAAPRQALTAATTLPAFTIAMPDVQQRMADRALVMVMLTHPAMSTTATLQTRAPVRIEVEAIGLFEPPAVETVAVQQRMASRLILSASKTFTALAPMVSVQKRAAPRKALTAATTLPALTGTAQVVHTVRLYAGGTLPAMSSTVVLERQTRARHLIEGSATHPAMSSTVAVTINAAVRHIVVASTTLSVMSSTAQMGKRDPVTASATMPAITGTASVLNRLAVRHEIEASTTLPAMSGSVSVQTRTPLRKVLTASVVTGAMVTAASVFTRQPMRRAVEASTTIPALSGTGSIAQRIADRLLVQASATLPAMSATTQMDKGIPVAGAGTYPAISAMAQVQQRMSARQQVQVDGVTLPAMSSAADVLQRTSARHVLMAAQTLPAMSSAAVLGKRNPVEASATLPAISASVAVQQRMSARQALQFIRVFPEMVGSLALDTRPVLQHQLTLPITTFGAISAAVAVQKRTSARKALEASTTMPAMSSSAVSNVRTVMERLLAASRTFFPVSARADVETRVVVRHVLLGLSFRSDPITIAPLTLGKREPQPPEALQAATTLPALTTSVVVNKLGAPEKVLESSFTYPPASFTVAVQKGAAMPPDMVTGLMLVLAGHSYLEIMWLQPGLGTGILMHYEYRLNGGSWVSTQSAETTFIITGLMPDTDYSIEVRAVTNVGRGPASAPLDTRTLAVTLPTQVRYPSAVVPGGGFVDLAWYAPADDGGSVVTDYEIQVTDPDGNTWPADSTGTGLTHRVRGLRAYQRYGFQVRARNMVGAGSFTDILYATPVLATTQVTVTGQQVPLLDVDRQSLIVRLGGQDCRIYVWWQPSDGAWYGSIEVPVNTSTVAGRRLAVNSGLLDRLPDVLPGNVVCRAVDDDSATHDPVRDAWRRPSHGLFWEPNS